jgi:hypothetical protein
MRIFGTSGNILIQNGGTFTDAGYRLDVAGTIRSQGSLVLLNPAFTFGGSITHSANSTLVIAGGPGGGENITIGPSNRIFINAQQSRFPNGSVQIGWTLTLGSTNATGNNMLLMQGSITAGSAIGRGIGMDTTLVAAANNDVLIGVDINPTFTNGAFTGVSNFAARIGGDVLFTQGAKSISIAAPSTSGSGGGLTISAGNATTSGTGGSISIQPGNGAGGPGAGTVIISNTSRWNGATVNGTLTVTNSGPNTGTSLQVNAGGQNGLSIFWDNLTPFMQYGLVSNRQARFVNSSSYTFSSKVFIGTNVDAGFNFDVNGTARVQGVLTASANNITGVLAITNASTATSISMASLLASGATGDTYFSVGRALTNNNSALIGHSTVGGGNYAFITVYGRPANDFAITSTGQVALGTSTPNSSARLQVDSTNSGLLPPRMTNAQMLAIATPAEGLVVYDLTNKKLYCYDGTTWQPLF